MSESAAPQYIQVANQRVELPPGVTVAQWGLERVRWQNPRIRAFLGCTRLLGEVLESNYAILHCSPERLREIWRKVRKVADLMRNDLGPLLAEPSCIPSLETARQSAEQALEMLSRDVLSNLDRLPAEIPGERLLEVRKLLCISIGQLHAFLQDTFGEMMAGDPRSVHDADYFLSKRFPQDIDEAEWLHATVQRLLAYLEGLEASRRRHLTELARTLQRDSAIPAGRVWEEARSFFVDELLGHLTPKLKEVLALRGIRFHEMEIVDRYAVDIPNCCHQLIALQEAGQEISTEIQRSSAAGSQGREQGRRDRELCQAVVSRRMAKRMLEVDDGLRDLIAFVPLWLQGIERRRALMLKRSLDDSADAWPGEPQTEEELDRLLR